MMKKIIVTISIFVLGASFYFNDKPQTKAIKSKNKAPKTMSSQEVPERTLDIKEEEKVELDQIIDESISLEEQKKITAQTEKDFLEIEIPTSLPKVLEERFKVSYDLYLKASFYLNEVAANNISPTRENLQKAMALVVLHSKDGVVSDVSNVLNIIEKEYPKEFIEALKELSVEDETLITDIQKRMDY